MLPPDNLWYEDYSAVVFVGGDNNPYLQGEPQGDSIKSLVDAMLTRGGFVEAHRDLVQRYEASLGRDLELLIYEGGTHLDGRNEPYQPAFVDAELDGRMYDSMVQLLNGLNDLGVDRFLNYQTETFRYTVADEDGATSNEATVTVNVVSNGGLVRQQGSAVIVDGTDGNDRFEFAAAGRYRLIVNGTGFDLDPAAVGSVNFSGAAGNDTVLLTGSADSDTAMMSPHAAILSGAGYRVSVAGAESILVRGGGGRKRRCPSGRFSRPRSIHRHTPLQQDHRGRILRPGKVLRSGDRGRHNRRRPG